MKVYHGLWQAVEVGQKIISLLRADCHEAMLCGSARRERDTVSDIEIVCCLHIDRPSHLAAAAIHAGLHRLMKNGHLRYDEQVKRRGPKYQRFLAGPSDLVVEIFLADEWNYGYITALRTGDADFSHLMVTPQRSKGLLPAHLVVKDGYMWERSVGLGAKEPTEKVCCSSEEEFFAHLGIEEIPHPRERDKNTAIKLARMLKTERELVR